MKIIPAGRDLETKSMPLDTMQANGYMQKDTHSMYSMFETKITHEWFKNKGNRTFILSRSSSAGQGKFASKWLGDNYAKPEFMGYSVSGVM